VLTITNSFCGCLNWLVPLFGQLMFLLMLLMLKSDHSGSCSGTEVALLSRTTSCLCSACNVTLGSGRRSQGACIALAHLLACLFIHVTVCYADASDIIRQTAFNLWQEIMRSRCGQLVCVKCLTFIDFNSFSELRLISYDCL